MPNFAFGQVPYLQVVSGRRSATKRAFPVRVTLSHWSKTNELPRAVATRGLLLRAGPSLDSAAVGKLPEGGEVFLLETRELTPGTKRSRVTATSTAAPLGWVTSAKQGEVLLMVRQEPPAASSGKPAQKFYTSLAGPEKFHAALTFISDLNRQLRITSTPAERRHQLSKGMCKGGTSVHGSSTPKSGGTSMRGFGSSRSSAKGSGSNSVKEISI